MNYEWKIQGVKTVGDLITQAKYYCRAARGSLSVDTEGTWFFKDPQLVTPLAEVTEEMVIDWIKEQTEVEQRLSEQVEAVENDMGMSLPWSPTTFTPKFEE